MSECPTVGGEGSAYCFDQKSGVPGKGGFLFYGDKDQSGATYFPTVTRNEFIVRTKIVVSDVFITCSKFESGSLRELWTTRTNCYGGVKIVGDLVVAADGIYRIDSGECLVSIPKEDVDIRTRSVLYDDLFIVSRGDGQSFSVNVKSGQKSNVEVGPLERFSTATGIALGVDRAERKLVATSLVSSSVLWRFNLTPLLEGSGWNLTQRVVPVCIRNNICYLVVGQWLVLIDLISGDLINKFEYFDSSVQSKLVTVFPGLLMGSHCHANQIASNGSDICLINYGHPSWIMLLDSEMKMRWLHITSEQAAGAIVGGNIFTTSESYHRAYDLLSGNEIWKSELKSSCNNIFVFGESSVCFEDANGYVEIFDVGV